MDGKDIAILLMVFTTGFVCWRMYRMSKYGTTVLVSDKYGLIAGSD